MRHALGWAQLPMTSKSGDIVGIQYLRGLAAIAVVIDHTVSMATFPKYFNVPHASALASYGMLGVNLFFVISGFIIAYTSLEFRDGRYAAKITVPAFSEKRFFRIVPVMWAAIALYMLGRFVGRDFTLNTTYLNAFLLLPFGNVEPNQIWTLRQELFFYIMFAISFLRPRQAPWLIGLWGLSPLLYAIVAGPRPSIDAAHQFLWLATFPMNITFLVGLAIGLLHLRLDGNATIRVGHFAFPLAIAMMAILWGIGFAFDLHVDDLRSALFTSLICGPIVLVATRLDCPGGILDRFGRLLGKASFAIYLFHPHAASASLGILARLLHRTHFAPAATISTLIAVLAGILAHYCIEEPVHKACRRLASRMRGRTSNRLAETIVESQLSATPTLTGLGKTVSISHRNT
ncbi:putative exopolysaccharide production protein ExoZ [Novosphingobium nitrogenifigens DSM 19370]|uniref:Putative exopolysaccharide production protein ExoZ n=1 Tax=Novosphingobium nitrogenifigens DSM 19370 TaxID=983920 RepID=F1ZDT9_9SPHN|nr:acyltransferase [Novosphingobium nitrogenifigens]EGD57224.1 putative exopolysaccharide production protein ExoZ [Novosphingobium nitrogenifigens DSM 19370]